MKLETSIALRKDGTVRVQGLDKQTYVFQPEPETGMVVCEVSHPETVAHLLRFGSFYPADEADHETAAALIDLVQDPEGEGDAGDDMDDDEADPNALPLEASTPPAPRKKKAKAE